MTRIPHNLPSLSSIVAFIVALILVFATVGEAVTVDDALVVSSFAISKIYKPDGSTGNFNGETHSDDGFRKVFNGDFSDKIYMNTVGSYIEIDLSSTVSNYVTKVVIGHRGNSKYSLYYTEDGLSWTSIVERTTTADICTYVVNHVAKRVKYVFDTVVNWQPSLTEIQVWGLNPSEMECLHEAQYLSAWEPIPGSATCAEPGYEQSLCSNCGTCLTRPSATIPPLGHAFSSVLDYVGSGLHFGSGTIECSRHDVEIVCTNGPVDLTLYGGAKTDGIYQFTDISASSTGNPDWGVRVDYLIDGNWTKAWNHYWYAASASVDEYVQFDFGVEIDLTSMDISVHNKNHTVRFCAVENGVERIFAEHAIVKDMTIPDKIWNEKNGKNEDNPASFQRFSIDFFGVSLQTLRIKSDDSNNALTICEVHPYGTVKGAGKMAIVRTRIIID